MTSKLSTFTSGKNGTFRKDPKDLFKVDDVRKYIIAETVSEEKPFINRVVRIAMSNINQATSIIDETTKQLDAAHDRLLAKQSEIGETSKKASGAVRDAHQKLVDGLERINKTADFARLERHVELLERAAAAMSTLAELDKSGHLHKFSQALK